jgi:hypothetical protein
VVDHLRSVENGAFARHDDRGHRFDPVWMTDPEHGGFGDAVEQVQRFFDFAARDVSRRRS